MSDKRREYWSECNQVYFLDGYGWGLTDKCQRICLGKEKDVLNFLETGILNGNFHPKQKEILNWILEYRKDAGYGESDTGTANMERGGNNGASRDKSKPTRLSKTRKRLPLRSFRSKNKNLSGK
jgi:hypothetical protein